MTKWYKTMFEAKLAEFWLRLSDLRKEQTVEHVAFLKEALPKKGLTLDHCCGPGRLCIALAQDRPVVGFDLSRELLREAKKRGKNAKAKNLSLVRADMRHLPLKPKVFDGVINMWTSFGFFSEPENQLVLEEIARVMRDQGVFVMEIANPEALIRVYQEKDWSEVEQFFMLEQRNWDWETKRMKCRWVYIDKARGKTYETHFDHRLYSYTELQRMFEMCGLKTTNVYASFSKEKFDVTRSTRMVLVAKKQTVA
jgi:ubiquinone/menaquinone biosynthesis C-methylase UbiE